MEARLDKLAQITGRARATVLHELIEQGLDDLEDAVLGASWRDRVGDCQLIHR